MNAILKDPLLKLRPMRTADLSAVERVERAAYQHPWTPGIFRDCLRVGYCCWVCELDQRPIGHGVMSVAVGEAHLLNLCVHPEWQGRGIGRRLLQRLLRIAGDNNADVVFLEVRASNQAAKRLYESLGFNEVGVRHGYYPCGREREDALVYAKSISP